MFLCFLKLHPATDMQCSTNFFQIMFQSVSILFFCIFVPLSYGSQKMKEEEVQDKEERIHKMLCATKRGSAAGPVQGGQPQRKRSQQLA